MTIKNLIIGVVGSLLAAGIAALFSYTVLRNKNVKRFLFSPFRRSLGKKLRNDPKKAVRALIRWLGSDQSTEGIHFGQFGSGANLKEERLFQTTREKLEAKPRLYLTGWPCFVLHRFELGKNQLSLAIEGIERLLESGPIEVSLGASEETPPDSQPTILSYRHTIRAVQILARLESNNRFIAPILGLMLDERNGWQNPDGGWKQCDRERTNSDLWGSSYALAFLASLLHDQLIVSREAKDRAHTFMFETMKYLKGEWYQSGWKYSKASAEHNGVQIFHETINTFERYDKLFAEELRTWVRGWLSPNGRVSDSYYRACHEVSLASANARVAYALFLAGEPQSSWEPLVLVAADQFEEGVNSADASFLLHMISELYQGGFKNLS